MLSIGMEELGRMEKRKKIFLIGNATRKQVEELRELFEVELSPNFKYED